jgi:hypothetical protein
VPVVNPVVQFTPTVIQPGYFQLQFPIGGDTIAQVQRQPHGLTVQVEEFILV